MSVDNTCVTESVLCFWRDRFEHRLVLLPIVYFFEDFM